MMNNTLTLYLCMVIIFPYKGIGKKVYNAINTNPRMPRRKNLQRSEKERDGLVLQTIGKEKLNRVKEKLCYFKKLKLKYQVAWHDVVTL